MTTVDQFLSFLKQQSGFDWDRDEVTVVLGEVLQEPIDDDLSQALAYHEAPTAVIGVTPEQQIHWAAAADNFLQNVYFTGLEIAALYYSPDIALDTTEIIADWLLAHWNELYDELS